MLGLRNNRVCQSKGRIIVYPILKVEIARVVCPQVFNPVLLCLIYINSETITPTNGKIGLFGILVNRICISDIVGIVAFLFVFKQSFIVRLKINLPLVGEVSATTLGNLAFFIFGIFREVKY